MAFRTLDEKEAVENNDEAAQRAQRTIKQAIQDETGEHRVQSMLSIISNMEGGLDKLEDLLKFHPEIFETVKKSKFLKEMNSGAPNVIEVAERVIIGNKKLIEDKIYELKNRRREFMTSDSNPPYLGSDDMPKDKAGPTKEYIPDDTDRGPQTTPYSGFQTTTTTTTGKMMM